MIFLKNFVLCNEDNPDREFTKSVRKFVKRNTRDEYYPLWIFFDDISQRIMHMSFSDITILYGGNGAGKTTLLNIMAEKLEVARHKHYLHTEAFDFYISECKHEYVGKPLVKRLIASDDIFDHILTIREENKDVKHNKNVERKFHWDSKYGRLYPNGVHLDFENPEGQVEIEKFRRSVGARKVSTKQFVRSRAGEMRRQYSNGENALMFFDKAIEEDSLYFLDEPENSMSPKFQIELKGLIEDSVRHRNCQFVIATHSPFILALRHAKIYNLDASPVTVEQWHKLENVRHYYDFFKTHNELFEQ